MMVQESSTLEKKFVLLVQTKNKDLERLLSGVVRRGNIHLESVDSYKNLNEQRLKGEIITFLIGSDVEDPVQSAQRFHALKKSATIVLLSKTGNVESLKKTIKFSPFIGVDVICLNESKKTELKKRLGNILQESRQAENYRNIIEETNSQISLIGSSEKPAYNQNFVTKLMDIAPIGIAIVDQGIQIMGWNRKAASIFKRSEAEVLGTSLSQFFNPSEANKLKDYLKENSDKRITELKDSLLLQRTSQSKTQQVLSLTAAPFTYSRGVEKAFILTVKDITEREQVKKDLQDINATLEERVEERTASLLSYQDQLRSLASRLSKAEEQERQRLASELHDNLGQMLALNKMKIDLLPKDQISDEIFTEIEEIKQGIDDALVYARNLMSDLKPPPSPGDENIKTMIVWLAQKMEQYDLEVFIDDDEQPKRVSEEIRTTLLQSVRELLLNIIKHTDVHRAVVRMSRHNSQAQIVVEDKGKGIDDLVLAEKSGFGLFNIKERMGWLGGSMEINSERDMGTKVTLTVPLKSDDSTDVAAGNDEAKSRSGIERMGRKIKIMLVDDHQMIRESLRQVVDAEDDMEVVAEASDGKEAIELARKILPDIIVMDVNMPRVDGIEATNEIISTMSNVRVVGLSLHDDPGVVNSMKEAGATAYLSKSEAFETLCATLRSEAGMLE